MSTATPARPAPRPVPSARPRSPVEPSRATGVDPFRVMRRHLIGIIAAVFLGAGLGVAAFFLLRNYYPLYSEVVYFEVKPGVVEASDISTQGSISDDEVIRIGKTELVLLMSREVLWTAVNNPDVSKTEWFKQFVDENEGRNLEEAVDDLEESLKTGIVRDTQLFEVKWSAHRKEDVPIVLNAVARAYQDRRKELDDAVYRENYQLFKDQLKKTNQEISDLDQEISDFIRRAGITTLDDPRFGATAQAVEGLTRKLNESLSELNLIESITRQTERKLEGTIEYAPEDILMAENDPAVGPHISNVENLKVTLRINRDKFGANHPEVVRTEGMLRASQAEKKSKIEEIIVRNLNARLQDARDAKESLLALVENLEDEIEVKSIELRELAAQQSQYDTMRDRRVHLETSREADVQLIKAVEVMRVRADASRVKLAKHALTPRGVSFPRPEIVVPLGVLLVVGATLGIIFLRELTDQRVKGASDLDVVPGARVLGVVPDLDDDPTECGGAEIVVRRFPNSVLAESYRQTAAPLTKGVDRAGHRTILFVGGLPGAGTTTAVSNFAASFAASGRRVLVIDANFRRPRVAEIFGVDRDSVGLGDLLAESASIDDVIHRSEEAGVSVIAAGTPGSRLIERLSSEKFDSVVAELRDRFDLILFDAPPAVVAGEPLVLASRLDAAVLVVRANREQRGLVGRLVGQLNDTRCELLGIILNRPRGTAGGYFKKNFATMASYSRT